MIFIFDLTEDFLYQLTKRKSIPDKRIVEILEDNFEDLLTIPDKLLFSVTEIIILNYFGNTCEITTEIYKDFLKSIKINSKKAKYLSRLLMKANIKNIKNQEEVFTDSIFFIKDCKNLEFIFFDIFLTFWAVNYLWTLDNLKGYRLEIEDTEEGYEEIEMPQVYLFITYSLYLRPLFLDNKKISDVIIWQDLQAAAIKSIKDDVFNKRIYHHVFMFKQNENDVDKFIKILKKEFGAFKIHYCTTDGTNLPQQARRIIIFDFEELNSIKRREILEKISDGNFKNIPIFFIVNESIELRGYPEIEFDIGLSKGFYYDFINKYFNIFKPLIYLLEEKIEEYKSLIPYITNNENEKNKLTKRLENISKCGPYFNINAIDFWHFSNALVNLNEEIINKIEEESSEFEEELEELLSNKSRSIKILLKHDNNFKEWDIKINGEKICSISSELLGMKYMEYLYFHHQKKSIPATELRKKFDKRSNKKYNTINDANSIGMALKYIISKDKFPQLEPLTKCIETSKNDQNGCKFNNKNKLITVEFIKE